MILGLMTIFMGLGVILYGGYAVKLGVLFIKKTIKGTIKGKKKVEEETTDEVVEVVEDVKVEEEVKEAE